MKDDGVFCKNHQWTPSTSPPVLASCFGSKAQGLSVRLSLSDLGKVGLERGCAGRALGEREGSLLRR
jgi:hypothetical protein